MFLSLSDSTINISLEMASLALQNEYSEVIRLPYDCETPPGHTFISSKSPIAVQQLSRELSLARGRIIYEVWDTWTHTIAGYAVPSDIARLASLYKHGVSTKIWNELPSHRKGLIMHAYMVMMQRFPRIPEIAAIRVAEEAERDRWNGERSGIDDRVVNHAKHEWTSYQLRVQYFHQFNQRPSAWSGLQGFYARRDDYMKRLRNTKEQALEDMKPRMREVLRSWLSEDISYAELAKFWRRHELYDSSKGEGRCRKEDGLFESLSLQYHGGLETPGNLICKVEGFL